MITIFSPVLRKKKSRSLRDLLFQTVFVMQAPEHGRLWSLTGTLSRVDSGKPGPNVE
jgi:hypothetical protein